MDIRTITEEELEPFYTSFMRTMGFGPPSEGQLERDKSSFIYERSLAAVDEKAIVGTAYSHLLDLTMPGGSLIQVAGVTAISVASTHRRRGIVTDLKRRQLLEALERGEPAALLLASEGRIYRRFGYGVCTQVSDIKIVVRDGRIEHRPLTGRIRIVEGPAMDEIQPVVHTAMAHARVGCVARPKYFWDSLAADRDKKTVNVVHEGPDGDIDGYARYDVKADWHDGLPTHKLTIQELVGMNDSATFDLWTYLLGVDLVREVTVWGRPIDEPLRWLLDEPRAVRAQSMRDLYWLRPLDVERVLSSRTYGTDVDLTIEVADPLLDLGGTFTVTGGVDGGSCVRSTASPDLRMLISELGSITMGGITPTELARAGRIEEVTPGAVQRADVAFVTAPRPWGDVGF